MNTNKPDKPELYGLEKGEKWWRDHYDLLKRHGYELRPRYHPGWTPSWQRKKRDPMFCEDSHWRIHSRVNDAIRISDGTRVAIKKLRKGSKELSIVRYLTSDDLRDNPKNHTVPILDVFSEEDDMLEFMVMPLLLMFNEPPFSSVDEAIDFMRQTLEGLSFIHSKGVAHRDCSILNIMMDGDALYPKGFHPAAPEFDASGEKFSSPRHRRDASAVRYYFTDFGISSRFENSAPRLVTGKACQDKELPEIHQDEPYDPFPVDVFLLGNAFKQTLVDDYESLDFLAPLIALMTQQDPKARPTADASLRLLDDIIKKQSPRSLRGLLFDRNVNKLDRFFYNVGSFKREATFVIKSYLTSFRRR